jgi:hypothetical protein
VAALIIGIALGVGLGAAVLARSERSRGLPDPRGYAVECARDMRTCWQQDRRVAWPFVSDTVHDGCLGPGRPDWQWQALDYPTSHSPLALTFICARLGGRSPINLNF